MALKMKGLTTFRNGIDEAIDRGAFKTGQEAKTNVAADSPVDEGDLQSSARLEPDSPSGQAEYEVKSGGIQGPNKFVDYAEYVDDDQPYFDEAVGRANLRENVRVELKELAGRSKA